MIDHASEVSDLLGTRILAIEQMGDTYYITTDSGLFEYDKFFLFPKNLFIPTLGLLKNAKP